MEFYSCSPNELLHYGVKGMKWGVRKKRVGSVGEVEKTIFNKINSFKKDGQEFYDELRKTQLSDLYSHGLATGMEATAQARFASDEATRASVRMVNDMNSFQTTNHLNMLNNMNQMSMMNSMFFM